MNIFESSIKAGHKFVYSSVTQNEAGKACYSVADIGMFLDKGRDNAVYDVGQSAWHLALYENGLYAAIADNPPASPETLVLSCKGKYYSIYKETHPHGVGGSESVTNRTVLKFKDLEIFSGGFDGIATSAEYESFLPMPPAEAVGIEELDEAEAEKTTREDRESAAQSRLGDCEFTIKEVEEQLSKPFNIAEPPQAVAGGFLAEMCNLLNEAAYRGGAARIMSPYTALQQLNIMNGKRPYHVYEEGQGMLCNYGQPKMLCMVIGKTGIGKELHLNAIKCAAQLRSSSVIPDIESNKAIDEYIYGNTGYSAFFAVDEAQNIASKAAQSEAWASGIIPKINKLITSDKFDYTPRQRKAHLDLLRGDKRGIELELKDESIMPDEREDLRQQLDFIDNRIRQVKDEAFNPDFYVGVNFYSQPETFSTMLNENAIKSGFFGRSLLCLIGGDMPHLISGKARPVQTVSIDDRIKNLLNKGRYGDIKATETAGALLEAFTVLFDSRINDTFGAIYARAPEMMRKVAAALGSYTGEITDHDAIYAAQLIDHSIQSLAQYHKQTHGGEELAAEFVKQGVLSALKDKRLTASQLVTTKFQNSKYGIGDDIKRTKAHNNKVQLDGSGDLRLNIVDKVINGLIKIGKIRYVKKGDRTTKQLELVD